MSLRAMLWAFDDVPTDLSPTEKLLLLALADDADDDGLCWPGQRRLARRCVLSSGGLRKAIGRLVDRELVAIEDKGGGRRSARYRLALPPRIELPRAPERALEQGGDGRSARFSARSARLARAPERADPRPGPETPRARVREDGTVERFLAGTGWIPMTRGDDNEDGDETSTGR